jgi:hypothetical protein
LDRLAETRLGDIMALLISVLRLQISGVRADLEAQAQGFSGYNDAQTESSERIKVEKEKQQALANDLPAPAPAGSNAPGGAGRAFGTQQDDIYAYMSSQATAYVVLSAICTIMQKSNSIYATLDKVLAGESRVVKFLQDYLNKLETQCPGHLGGAEVIASISAYESAIKDRLNGGSTSNRSVISAGQIAIRRIEEYERFLACFKSELFFGNDTLETIVSAIGTSLSTYQTMNSLISQIKMVIRMYPQMEDVYKKMDLAKLMGIDAAGYNALDTITAGLQCLVLQCDNPAISNLASLAAQQFQDQFARKKSEAITMGTIDDIPKTGLISILTKRVQALMRLMQLIRQITSADLTDLCAIKTAATTDLNTAPTEVFPGSNQEELVTDTASWRRTTPQPLGA